MSQFRAISNPNLNPFLNPFQNLNPFQIEATRYDYGGKFTTVANGDKLT